MWYTYRSRESDLQALSLNINNEVQHNSQRQTDITKDICEETLRLCMRAGLSGVISMKVLGTFVDITRKSGHSIHAPSPYGVPVTWRGDGNHCVRAMLNCSHIELKKLYEQLRSVSGATNEEELVKTDTMPDRGSVLSRILGEDGEPRESHEPPTEREPANESASGSNLTDKERSALSRFLNDSESVELFLMEMASHVNERGEFSAKEGVDVLRAQFGFTFSTYAEDRTNYNKPYDALLRLGNEGKLEKCDFGWYRIPKSASVRPQGHDAEEAPAPVEPSHTETREPIPARVLSAAGLRATVETLLGRSNAYREAIERRTAILAEIDEIHAKLKPLQQREGQLSLENAALNSILTDPSAREAVDELEVIRKLLG